MLKKGYTTGVHTSFAFKSAIDNFLSTKKLSIAKTIKSDNDDLDVTKGCEIVVMISFYKDELSFNPIFQKPYIIKSSSITLELYAGEGVGVATKDGIKPPKNYPAINPIPLQSIQNIIFNKHLQVSQTIYCTICVTNGQEISKQTANSKVGVIGGISILGTKGWVKPISSTAYINSIETELNFAKINGYNSVVFTLGNNSLKKANDLFNNSYIIEIGNFIYDGIYLAIKKDFKNITLVCGIAKAVKISQGFKNTHNRFGSIDFIKLQQYVDMDISSCVTVKRVLELLKDDTKLFYKIIKINVIKQLYFWFNKDINIVIL